MRLLNKFAGLVLACLALTACDGIDTKTPEPVPLADLPAPTPTILDVAIEAGNFTTLIAAIDAAGLTSTIDDASATLTVFAPTDDAIGRGVRDPPPIKSAIGTPATCPAISQHAISMGDFAYK